MIAGGGNSEMSGRQPLESGFISEIIKTVIFLLIILIIGLSASGGG
jgi:hypothetical protein